MDDDTVVKLPCQTCQRRTWNVRLGMWVYSRETVGLVCQTCGTDYGLPTPDRHA